MVDITIDMYFSKLFEIKTTCDNIATTKLQLQTLITELQAIDDQLEMELDATTTTPTDFTTMRKVIFVELERTRKSTLHNSILKLLCKRRKNLKDFCEVHTTEEIDVELNAIDELDTYIMSLVDSCNCMADRKFIVQHSL